ncbi:MAG: crotonase/enoyl-CoA hydratase family protein [Alphaproteobacteria bacterium]|nr:crotonase/enoyl-CoA hydratase family protein [Alphaproteobacteria bacterium]MBV9373341.1 crotonase/enoyl-CoA hydratase family protein [Alphaproteobacteria bacterium]MBV9902577.1 crotonase/enoyl-CoA hydratase family protein [Alphaproteobacteria bacterium]
MNHHFSLQPAEDTGGLPLSSGTLAGTIALQHRERPAGTSLFDLGQLDVTWEAALGTLWTYMTPVDRPNFNRPMLRDFQRWQSEIRREFADPTEGLKYLVLGSRFPGVFNLGGDLDLFAGFIAAGDREGLVRYGRDCVSILHENMRRLELPIVTIALVQGDALGGGFEAVLSFNVVVAERGSRFGLPEIAFGLFPGMGAHCLLARKVGLAKAEEMMLSNRMYSAEEMHELGLVHVLAEPGQGEEAVRAYVARNGRRQSGHRGIYHASSLVDPITLDELNAVVDVWADSALCLSASELKLMKRLVEAQARLAGA